MENELVVHALIRKRAEIAGLINHHHAEITRLVAELDSLDTTICMFAPPIVLEEIEAKRLPPPYRAQRGEISQAVFTALRAAPSGMTARDLTFHVMAARGMDASDRGLVRVMTKRVHACLKHHRRNGVLCSAQEPGQNTVWEFAS